MKNQFKFIIIIIAICTVFLLPLFRHGFYASHDGEAHVARFAAYFKAFQDGQILPRWAGDLNFGYGSPLFIFYYPLPGIIASAIHALGIGLEDSFKIIMGLSFVFAPLAFYAWSSLLVGRKAAFIGSLLYGLAPYHFLDLYVRGDIAEMLSYIFAPLVFLYLEKTKKKSSFKNVLIGGVCYALLILSHNAISLMFSPVFFTYSFIQVKKREFIFCIMLLLTGLLLSSFFWLPALIEGRFTQAAFFIGEMYKLHFPTFQQLVYSSWGFDADVFRSNGLSPQIGPLHIFLAFVGGLFILKKTKESKITLYWFLLFIFAIFLSLRQSEFIWQNVPLLKLFQFPWRITGLSSFIAAVLGMYVLRNISNAKNIIIILLLIILSIPLVKIKGTLAKDDKYYYTYKGNTDYHRVASTIWSAGDPGKYAKNQIEIIEGNARIKNLARKSNLHEIIVDADSQTKILDNTIYFPGWQVFVDKKKVRIEFQDINHRGLITFNVPKDRHNVKVIFTESSIRFISDAISLLTVVLLTAGFMFHKRIDLLLKKL